MVGTVCMLVTFFLIANASRLPVQVYEILKTRSEPRVDVQYYDPDLERISLATKHNKKNINVLENYIMDSLKRVPQNYEDSKSVYEDAVIFDDTKSLPVLLVPNDKIVYRNKPKNYNVLHKLLHSALRTNDAEDRTAAPRHLGNYDKDYYF